MSEKMYALLLRLYPRHFRETHGDEAMQLFRDRARNEQGLVLKLRLWFDLLTDLAVSLPREYRYLHTALAGGSSRQRAHDGPSFAVLEDGSPHPGALFVGGILSLALLTAFPVLINHAGNNGTKQVPNHPSSRTHHRATLSSGWSDRAAWRRHERRINCFRATP